MIAPHGGSLIERYLTDEEVLELQRKIPECNYLVLDEVECSDLQLIASGAYSPLTGFMGQKDYLAVLEHSRLDNGLVWTLPVVLSVSHEQAVSLQTGDIVALVSAEMQFQGILVLDEIFERNLEQEAQAVFGIIHRDHPGVDYLLRKERYLVSGKIQALKPSKPEEFLQYPMSPLESRTEFQQRGWQTVVAFQTRNPIHRAHEYLQKVALEMVDGLFIHPLVGFTKTGDIPAKVRMKCYETLISGYYPASRVILGVFPAAMRYAGPREAVFHALVRKNYGCTHFIVGRDHAGVGNFYGTYDAQNIFNHFTPEEIGITILKFENSFYCKRCGGYASEKTCPHQEPDRLSLSGTKIRTLLSEGLPLPPEFTRPEISKILMDYYHPFMCPNKPGWETT